MRLTAKGLLVIGLMTLVVVMSGCQKDSVQIRMAQMQTCLTMPDGTRVFIDVVAKKFAGDPFTEKDIMLITYPGPDHYAAELVNNFPGRKLLFTSGVIEQNKTRIELIPAARNEGEPITEINATDYLVLITYEDWRILYTGDLGQDHMTAEQLEKIGRVDICFASLDNAQWCNMTLENKKGFNLISEINPRLVIPLRYKDKSLEYAQTVMPVYVFVKKKEPFETSRKRLPETTSLLVMDEMASTFRSAYGLKDW
jgi:hypothetical protein